MGIVDDLSPVFSWFSYSSNTIESIILPSSLDLLSIWVGKFSVSMLDIIYPLTFILDGTGATCSENSVSMSHILSPISLIVRTVLPVTSTNAMSHPVHCTSRVIRVWINS